MFLKTILTLLAACYTRPNQRKEVYTSLLTKTDHWKKKNISKQKLLPTTKMKSEFEYRLRRLFNDFVLYFNVKKLVECGCSQCAVPLIVATSDWSEIGLYWHTKTILKLNLFFIRQQTFPRHSVKTLSILKWYMLSFICVGFQLKH